MGFSDWFTFRSKEQKRAESLQYAKWACPYGDEQRAKLLLLLSEILPEEGPKLGLSCYLIGREAYWGGTKTIDTIDDNSTAEERRLRAARKLMKQLRNRIGIELARYIALIEADATIDENLNYPSADELVKSGEELLCWLKEHQRQLKHV